MPVFGKLLVATAMLSSTCSASWAVRPRAMKLPNRSRARTPMTKPRQIDQLSLGMETFAEPEQFTGEEPELEPWMEFYTF